MFSVQDRIEHIRAPKMFRAGNERPQGTLMCADCRRDVPAERIVFGKMHQLCVDCRDKREARVRYHQQRVEREESLHGRDHSIPQS